MKKILIIFTALLTYGVSSYAQTTWEADPYHSSINFAIQHSGISLVNGKFTDFMGTLTTQGEDLTGSKFNFTVQVASINTNVDQRDNHLRSADFFEVEKFPTMKFESTKILKSGRENHYVLIGNLTIKGVTKEIVADLYYGGIAKSDQGEKMGLRATTTINRFDYNVDYDPTAAGIGRDVQIEVHLQFAKQ